MKQETGLTADKALEMKFVTEIVTATKAKAVAIINPKTMTKNQTTLKEKFNAFLQKHGVKAVFDETAADGTGSQQVQSLDVKLKDGSMIHIETASADPSIGDTVSVNGAAAPDKTFELEDGSIIKTDANSKIADITPAPAAAGTPAPADNTAALSAANAEIKKLNDKIASIEAANAEAKKTEAAMRAELEENKTMFAKIEEGMSKLQESTGSDFKPDPEAQRFRQNETNAGDMRADVKSGIDSFRRTAKERADKKKGIAPAAK
jgi:hypothetical protein